MESEGAQRSFRNGVELFNRGDFFEAHEAMEEAMDRADDDGNWDFYLGLLRAAVANHKLAHGELSSAIFHLKAALRFLAPFPDRHEGIKLRELRQALNVQLARLTEARDHGRAPALAAAAKIEFV